ncbi:DNA repair metallo-beta-lactamase-domain-containing protein [Chlamydoabsidia padenii]|nr:DNA repair metallo-beta-lactamase-domain-containing protein [Chlamydoabsidia padenii]
MKRSRSDDQTDTDPSKKNRTEQHTSLSNDAPPSHDQIPTIDNHQQTFEADIAKAIELSLSEGKEDYQLDTKTESPLLNGKSPISTMHQRPQQEQHQCPVCSVSLKLSVLEFEAHVNRCLDQQGNTPSIPTSTDQQTTTWQQLFKSIPKTLHDTFIGKVTSTKTSPASHLGSSNSIRKSTTFIKSTLPTKPSYQPISYKSYKSIPGYKWMKDTKFVVDAFSYGKVPGCEGYFLTHFHSDHYMGLKKDWSHGPIFCSKITANLVEKQLQVNKECLKVLPMNQPTFVLPSIKVTLIDANHCPGSVLFIFDIKLQHSGNNEGSTWVRHLHTGDFRANPEMCLHPLIRQPENPVIDTLYLDTTYLNAKYGFPAQEECIQAACRVVESHIGIQDDSRPKTALDQWINKASTSNKGDKSETGIVPTLSISSTTKKIHGSVFDEMMTKARSAGNRTKGLLVVVGTYSIGKEKVFCAIAKLLGSKIYVTQAKRSILRCQENKELENLLTLDQNEAQVHVLPLNHIKPENMYAYLKSLSPRFTSMIAFRPTGWTFRASKAQETEMDIGNLSLVTAAPMDRHLTLQPQHSSPTIKIYGVPYSEHSSFRELASFIASLDITHVVPTVNNGSERGRTKMMMYLDKWKQDKQGKPIQVVPYPATSHW